LARNLFSERKLRLRVELDILVKKNSILTLIFGRRFETVESSLQKEKMLAAIFDLGLQIYKHFLFLVYPGYFSSFPIMKDFSVVFWFSRGQYTLVK